MTKPEADSAATKIESREAEAEVLVRREGGLLRVTLNRPRAINALNTDMVETVAGAVEAADAPGGPRTILLDGAGERGFCGGGDIKLMAAGAAEANAVGAVDFLRAEYRADYRVAMSRLPVVAIMDGITMGGGIGLGGHAAVRVVTERSRLAMPEARIGIAPDVGGHLLLGRAPGRLGELLAITSGSMHAGDAIALGFADFFVPSDRLADLRSALATHSDPRAAVAELAEEAPASDVLRAREWFDPLAEDAFGGALAVGSTGEADIDPVAAVQRLVRVLEESLLEAARETAAVMRAQCPVSLAVTIAGLDRTRRKQLDLRAVLIDDLRVLSRLLGRPDFAEGVRARVIDKDGAPAWSPSTIEALENAEVARILAPLGPGEVELDL